MTQYTIIVVLILHPSIPPSILLRQSCPLHSLSLSYSVHLSPINPHSLIMYMGPTNYITTLAAISASQQNLWCSDELKGKGTCGLILTGRFTAPSHGLL